MVAPKKKKKEANIVKCQQLLRLGDGQMANSCSLYVFYDFSVCFKYFINVRKKEK